MNKKKYTESEKQFVIEKYRKMTAREIANSIGRDVSASAIKGLAKRLGVSGTPHTLFTEDEIDFVKNNYLIMTSQEIASKLNRTTKSIESLKHRMGFKKNDWDWDENNLLYLKNNYNKLPVKEIAKELNKDIDTIYNKAYSLGLKKEKYKINENYFENIDTQDKAYWLGFIITDGYIREYTGNKKSLTIGLKASDEKHLYKLKKSLDSDAPIYIKNSSRGQAIAVFSITNNKLCSDLIKWGVLPNKTYKNIQMPNIPKKFMRDFIRGYWDGDGGISIRMRNKKKSSPVLYVSRVTLDIIKNIQGEFKKKNIISNIYTGKTKSGKYSYRLTIYGRANVCKALEYLYIDSNIYLNRKLEKANEILNLWSPNKETY